MNKHEVSYETPITVVLELRFENTLLTVSSQGNDILPGTIDEWPDML